MRLLSYYFKLFNTNFQNFSVLISNIKIDRYNSYKERSSLEIPKIFKNTKGS